jgi:hypothetical protein
MRSSAGLTSFSRRGGGSRHASACTAASTLSKVRAVLKSAYNATTKTVILVKRDWLALTSIVVAKRPTMPAFEAMSRGSVPVAEEKRPKPYTKTNTYGTMNRKMRKATAAASTGPPAAVSRSTEMNATSMVG